MSRVRASDEMSLLDCGIQMRYTLATKINPGHLVVVEIVPRQITCFASHSDPGSDLCRFNHETLSHLPKKAGGRSHMQYRELMISNGVPRLLLNATRHRVTQRETYNKNTRLNFSTLHGRQ